jgi:hypothetical protein
MKCHHTTTKVKAMCEPRFSLGRIRESDVALGAAPLAVVEGRESPLHSVSNQFN